MKEAGPKPEETVRFAPGLRHIALRVKDFDKAYETLKKAPNPSFAAVVHDAGQA